MNSSTISGNSLIFRTGAIFYSRLFNTEVSRIISLSKFLYQAVLGFLTRRLYCLFYFGGSGFLLGLFYRFVGILHL